MIDQRSPAAMHISIDPRPLQFQIEPHQALIESQKPIGRGELLIGDFHGAAIVGASACAVAGICTLLLIPDVGAT
jgi:hypothetical protein